MIWIDIPHPKYCPIFNEFVKKVSIENIVITVRDGLWTCEICNLLGIKYYKVGRYGYNLEEKLLNEVDRIKQFHELFKKLNIRPKILIGVDSASIRYAFGINIPIICLNDTPKMKNL